MVAAVDALCPSDPIAHCCKSSRPGKIVWVAAFLSMLLGTGTGLFRDDEADGFAAAVPPMRPLRSRTIVFGKDCWAHWLLTALAAAAGREARLLAVLLSMDPAGLGPDGAWRCCSAPPGAHRFFCDPSARRQNRLACARGGPAGPGADELPAPRSPPVLIFRVWRSASEGDGGQRGPGLFSCRDQPCQRGVFARFAAALSALRVGGE